MKINCTCSKGFPIISKIQSLDRNTFLASHCCSLCEAYLFDTELRPGTQVITIDNIESNDGKYLIPKGRLLRITAFIELSLSSTGLLFSGLLAAGAFRPDGFAAQWDIEKLFDLEETI
jgi:hypothetical protein